MGDKEKRYNVECHLMRESRVEFGCKLCERDFRVALLFCLVLWYMSERWDVKLDIVNFWILIIDCKS